MRGWHNESHRHALAARGIKTMDTKLPGKKWLETTAVKSCLTPKLKKILLSAKDPEELTSLMLKHETEMAHNRNRTLDEWWGDYLVCDEAVEIMSYILKLKDIPHEVVMGFSDAGDTHVWIRVDEVSHDPTDQGQHEGQIIASWDPKEGTVDFPYIDPEHADDEYYWSRVVVP